MEVLRFIMHYGLHLLFPGLISYLFFKKYWKKVWLLMVLTMLIDLDHLLATPVYDAYRCSINYHPLHTYYAGLVYVFLLLFEQTKIFAIALILHLITDGLDCLWY